MIDVPESTPLTKAAGDGGQRLRVGLTGGIASGKSAVSRRLGELGAAIVDTDEVAREVVLPGTAGLRQVIKQFGDTLLLPDGTLDRAALRNRIFSDPAAKSQVEAILHPLIRARSLELAAVIPGPYIVLVVPLLLETGFRALVDRVLVVDCPPEIQLARLIERDRVSPEAAQNAIASQIDRDQRIAAADDLLNNSGTLDALLEAVDKLHHKYLKLATQAPG